MVSPGTAATLIGAASGIGTVFANILISKKTKGRMELGEGEVAMAMLAVGIGSVSAYLFIKSREQAMLDGDFLEDSFSV